MSQKVITCIARIESYLALRINKLAINLTRYYIIKTYYIQKISSKIYTFDTSWIGYFFLILI